MKAFFGLIQFGCGIGGLVALFNGQWLLMVVAWGAAIVVGLAGNRAVRATDGVSQTGQEALGGVSRSIELLRRGAYQSALGTTRSMVFSFRSGGDKALLPIALTLHAVAMAATGEVVGAKRALAEADGLFRSLPAGLADGAYELRQVHAYIQRELDRGVTDPDQLVAGFLAFNDA